MDKIILGGADVTPVFAENLPEDIVVKYALTTSISKDEGDENAFLKDYYAVKGNILVPLYVTTNLQFIRINRPLKEILI